MSAPRTPFEQGREHARLGKSIHYNPYRNRDGEGALYADWQEGWESYREETGQRLKDPAGALDAQSDGLPNQVSTWAGLSESVEEYETWLGRQGDTFANEDTALLVYLSDQLRAEGDQLVGMQVNHPVAGLLTYMSGYNNRLQELMYAYLALVVEQDSVPARKLIAGRRLKQGLHPDYVAATRCYGTGAGG